MKNRIYNLIILDESGSMESIHKATVDSVNETIQTIRSAQQKFENQEHLLTLVTFNTNGLKIKYDACPIERAETFAFDDFNPDCCTPLFDAMGLSMTRLEKQVREGDRVLVTIITDGYENASVEYTQSTIKVLVDRLRKADWMITYMGANQDVDAVAESLSINQAMAFTADEAEMAPQMRHANKCRMAFFSRASRGIAEPFADHAFFSSDEEDDDEL